MRQLKVLAMRERYSDVLLIVLVCLATAGLLRPFQDAPFIDDWVYAWPVERLLKMWDFRILEYSGSVNLAQVLWGALFALPGGFSFAALRLSTFVLGTASLCALYLMLRGLNVPRASALFGVAVLAIYPIFFILSFTFMTDVPLVACFIGAASALLVALRRQSTAWLVAAAVFIALSISMRFVGLAAAAALGMVLLFHAGSFGRRRLWVALIPAVITLLLFVWRQDHMVSPVDMTLVANSPAHRFATLRDFALPYLPEALVTALGFLAGAVGIALLPLAIAILNRRNAIYAGLILALLSAGLFLAFRVGIVYPLPLVPGGTWTLDEIGGAMPLVPGFAGTGAPTWVYWSVAFVGWASTSILLTTLSRRPSAIEWFFLWSIVYGLIVVAVLWLFHDRYALPLIVPVLVLVLIRAQQPQLLRAAPILALLAAVCLMGTRDHLSFTAALSSALKQTREFGAADSEINGGYVINGWNQYAHAAKNGFDTKIPWVNARNLLRYEISHSRFPDVRVLATVSYRRWLGPSGELYVFDRGHDIGVPDRRDAENTQG